MIHTARILVVDDDHLLASVLVQALNKLANVSVAHTFSDAKAAILAAPGFDLILTDVNLPDGSGFDVAKLVRSTSHCKNSGLIFLTVMSDEPSRLRGLSMNADDYLGKPISIEELRLRVRNKLMQIEKIRDFELLNTNVRPRFIKEHLQSLGVSVEQLSKNEIDFLRDLEDVILDRMEDHKTTLTDIAMAIGLSTRSLQRRVASVTGTSTKKLLIAAKMAYAVQLISQNVSVKVVSQKLGYASVSHFTTIFKDLYGIPPGSYLKDEQES